MVDNIEPNKFIHKIFFSVKPPLPFIPFFLVGALTYLYILLRSSLPEYSLFKPGNLDLKNYYDETFFMILLMWYITLLYTIDSFYNLINIRRMIVDNKMKILKVRSKVRGVIFNEKFSNISRIKFTKKYDSKNRKYKALHVVLFRLDDSEFKFFEGGLGNYNNLKEFLSNHPELEKLIEIDDN